MFGHDDHHDENDKQHEDHHQDDSWQHPGPPPSDDDLSGDDSSDDSKHDNPISPDEHLGGGAPEVHEDHPAPDFSISQHSTDYEDTGVDNSGDSSDKAIGGADNDLIDLKQEALTKLSPLIGHLDQTPDEKFRTLMMMIQASDDQRLVRQAYETALNIDDEKERAQALLDIVNEINYFTHNPASSSKD